MTETVNFTDNSNSEIVFNADHDKWVMKLTPKGIFFNREMYPLAKPDDFAQAVIDLLEKTYTVKFEKKLTRLSLRKNNLIILE